MISTFPVALRGATAPTPMWAHEHDVEPAALQQLRNIAALPWVHGVRVMPDVHLGKGLTIGSVIAMRDAVSPNAVGVDIGCARSCASGADLHEHVPAGSPRGGPPGRWWDDGQIWCTVFEASCRANTIRGALRALSIEARTGTHPAAPSPVRISAHQGAERKQSREHHTHHPRAPLGRSRGGRELRAGRPLAPRRHRPVGRHGRWRVRRADRPPPRRLPCP